jgi:hypothetical protein
MSKSLPQIILICLLLAGILKCIQVMRRPSSGTLCVLSLTLALGAWLVGAVLAILRRGALDSHPILPLVNVILAILFLAALLAGFVVGIVGLILYRNRREDIQQGRRQAIGGVVVSSLGLLLVCGGAVSAIGGKLGERPPLASSVAGEVKEYDDLNFRITVPARPWVELDADAFNPDSTVAYMRRRPEVYFMIIAEVVGVEFDFTSESLAAIAEGNLKAVASRSSFSEKTPESITGVAGIRFTSLSSYTEGELFHSFWTGSHNGYAWQLITWGGKEDEADVRRNALELAKSFKLIDPQRIFQGS